MLLRFHQLAMHMEKKEEEEEEEKHAEAPISQLSPICVSGSPKKFKERKRPPKSGPRRSQVDRVPSWPGAPMTPTSKLSTASRRTRLSENHNGSKTSTPKGNMHPTAESSTLVSPPPSPRRCPFAATSSPKKAGQITLPPPKSPLRLAIRRKASKPPKKTKPQVIMEKVEEKYDKNGSLQRTTITRIRHSDGSSSTEKNKECLNPTSPRYRQKPKVNQKILKPIANNP
jgi:hypothetical protein